MTRVDAEKSAPQLVSLIKAAAVSLEKNSLAGHRASVYLVLDHSGSMRGFYANGSVQRLAEQALALSANLDDDGVVPVVIFSTEASVAANLDLTCYVGVIEDTHRPLKWGTTNYVAAMAAVVEHYLESDATDPAFVIFQTDGGPDSRKDAAAVLRNASKLPVFWAFVGFGERVDFLTRLDDLPGRRVDNASHFHAAEPATVSDAELYDGLVHEYAGWLRAATDAGIVR